MNRIRYASGALAAVAALSLAACSSSGGSASPSSTAPAVTYKGEVKVGMIVDTSVVSAVGNPEPERVSAASARFDVINAAGGINGYKIVLDACDEKGDPNVAASCARGFVTHGDVATVADESVYGAKLNPALLAAGIPRVAPAAFSLTEYSATNNYPDSGGAITMYEGAILNAVANGAKSIYFLGTATEGADAIVGLLKPVAIANGLAWKGNQFITPGTPDVSPQVTAAMNSKADVVLISYGPDGTQQVLKTADQLGAKFRFASAAESYSDAVIKSTGSDNPLITQSLLVSPYPPVTQTQVKAVSQLKSEMDARQKAGDKNASQATRSHSFEAWLGALAFGNVASTITGPITAKSMTTALNTVKDVDMLGAIPPWTPTNSVSALLPRISNGYGWYVKIADGKQALAQPDAVEILKK